MMVRMSSDVEARLETIENATQENRELLNQIVAAMNEMAANLELIRNSVIDHSSSLSHLEVEVSRLSSRRLAKLTPIPKVCEGTHG